MTIALLLQIVLGLAFAAVLLFVLPYLAPLTLALIGLGVALAVLATFVRVPEIAVLIGLTLLIPVLRDLRRRRASKAEDRQETQGDGA